jgi:hypothetical protein
MNKKGGFSHLNSSLLTKVKSQHANCFVTASTSFHKLKAVASATMLVPHEVVFMSLTNAIIIVDFPDKDAIVCAIQFN